MAIALGRRQIGLVFFQPTHKMLHYKHHMADSVHRSVTYRKPDMITISICERRVCVYVYVALQTSVLTTRGAAMMRR